MREARSCAMDARARLPNLSRRWVEPKKREKEKEGWSAKGSKAGGNEAVGWAGLWGRRETCAGEGKTEWVAAQHNT